MFSEIWRWVEVSKYKVLKSLKGWGEGRCLPPPKKKSSMERKWTIPEIKYYITDTGQ